MGLEKLKEIIRKKPVIFLIISLVYFVLTGFIKWKIHPNLDTLTFLIGGLIGIYFLDIAEIVFSVSPSPFRSVVFEWAFAAVSLFIVTSSGSMIASGLVISIYLSMILWQIGEWEIHKNLNGWYTMLKDPVSIRTEVWILVGFTILFFVETFVFIFW